MDPLYDLALKLAENLPASATNISRVAKQTSTEAAHWAFSQWSLRQRASAKFEKARDMIFDKDGLEMATHERIAAYHASLFPSGEIVWDLTAGIGADFIAIAGRGPTVGFELDSARAEIAQGNLSVHGLGAEIHVEDALSATGKPQFWFADPARRDGGRRTVDPEQFSPNPLTIIEKFGDCELGAIKLSPMLPDDFLESFEGRLEFVSFGVECREALVQVGRRAESGRFAVLIETGDRIEASESYIGQVETPDEYFYEADPAAIRAHALPELAERYQLHFLGDSNGYLTGSGAVSSPWMKGFRVLFEGRGDLKSTKKELEQLDSQTPILKQRGAGQNLEADRLKLKLSGKRALTVAMYKNGASLRHAILESI